MFAHARAFTRAAMPTATLDRRGASVKTSASARPNWFPGSDVPAYLDGSMPCDYGFDPLKLGEKPENLARYREAELMHARWAMLGVAGAVAVEVTGNGTWVDAQPTTWDGTAKYLGNETHAPLFAVIGLNALLMAFAESQRGAASAEERLYPGGKFDPAGLAKGKDFETLKRKELANGRVAMLAFLGIMAQNQATPGGPGPVATLASHIADPWHVNVATNAAAIPWL